jgi:hypothetical protein
MVRRAIHDLESGQSERVPILNRRAWISSNSGVSLGSRAAPAFRAMRGRRTEDAGARGCCKGGVITSSWTSRRSGRCGAGHSGSPRAKRERSLRCRPRHPLDRLDTSARARDTRVVPVRGSSHRRLAGVLNSAFAEGLLSEQTHSYRLGLLFGPRLIDPQRLVGDLTLGRGRSRPVAVARHAWGALAASVRNTAGFARSSTEPLLLVLDGSGSDRLLVGRHPACDVVVADPSVSRRHAQLAFRDGAWVLQDLASTNGTTVNGERVGRTALHPGDVVELGNQAIQID